jgi:hypothetical protein
MKAKSGRISQVSMRWLTAGLLAVVFLFCAIDQAYSKEAKANRFEAIGLTEPVKMEPRKKSAVVERILSVSFLRYRETL